MSAMPTHSHPKGEQTRRRILDATLQVIADAGVRAVTHRSVARQAAAAPGLITYYFSSTDALIAGALADVATQEAAAFARLRAQVEETGDDPAALVELFVAEVMSRAGERKVTTTATLALTLELAGQHFDRSAFEAWEASGFALCDATVRALGGEPDPDLTQFLSSTLDGLFLSAVISPNAHYLESATRAGLTHLFDGLRMRPSDRRPAGS
ncbi:TetR/AcrR family transcriptional regulator [Nonomuraea sp. NPDC050227]|uniref:TetR/AcrR family transcriptional regulator n=1 Tax=Nonomuraea sp. NPDC050227 TaxID=3364360 RepID=UPI0037ADCD61